MITYGSTTLTSYNTITKIEVYYYKSTSATSLSGGSWSTTKPTWENGKYIWQKIRTTYEGELENGQYYSESDPVNITGQQGATGTAAYSYKLNASDTTITLSKTGVYSTNKITFTATSKQGTGSVNAYAGRFKIETTVNGTTWTAPYTSNTNESSKEYTIPTGIIAIRCSLYQAGGTSTLLDIMTIPILNDDRPIVTKTYSGLIGSANDATNASFYFAKIHPDNYTTNYKVKMKVRVTTPESYAETIDIQFGGYGSSFSSYDAYTTRTGSIGVYYINLYRATQAGISTNHKGHALGIGLRSSSNPTDTSYKRTVIIDILELDGCTIEMLDTAVKYASIDGTGSTNYYGLTEMAVGTSGQNATNNSNTHYTQYSSNVKAGTNGIKGYTLIMKDSENTWSCFYSGAYKVANTGKVAYTGGFMLGKILYSAGAGTQTSDSSLDTYYNYKSGVNTSTIYDAYPVDLRYSTNCASTLTSQRPVYIVGTIENDGLFHLDVSQWWTQTEPDYADGKVYIYVGMAYSSYQVWLSTENPAYMFYNGEFILYDKAQTLQNINTLKNSLETQIDSKVETWCQKTNPANSWTAEERPNHTGDLWYYIGESGTTYKNNTTYQYNGETNVWSAYSANPDLFDKIDGKTAIYYGTTSSVTSAEEGDYLVDSENDCTYRWNDGAWVLATDYKQVAIDAVEIGGRNYKHNSNFINGLNNWTIWNGATVTIEETNNKKWALISKTTSANYGGVAYELGNKTDANPMPIKSDDIITLSFDAQLIEGTGNCIIWLHNRSSEGEGNISQKNWTFPLTEIANRYSVTYTIPSSSTYTIDTIYAMFGIYGTNITKARITDIKIEKGNIATDWTPAPEDIEQELSSLEENLQSQIDEKIQTFYQSTNPASSWTTTELKTAHDGDLWYYTGTTTSTYIKDNVYRYNGSNNTWTVYSASGELFDKVDGKSTIFYGTTSSTYTGVETGDYLVDSTDGSSYRYDGSKWVKVTDYQSAIDAIEIGGRNLLLDTASVRNTVNYNIARYSLSEIGQELQEGDTVTFTMKARISSERKRWAIYNSGSSLNISDWKVISPDGQTDAIYTWTGTWKTAHNGTPVANNQVYVYAGTANGSVENIVYWAKLERGQKATDWTPAPEDTQADIDTALSQSIEYIIGTQTAATGNWTGVSSSLTELKDGTQIKYWLPYAGSGNASLNLTLKDGTSTGAIPIYRQGGSYNTTSQAVVANRVTTHFPAGTSISMVYGVNRVVSAVSSSVTYTGTFTGWFADGAYDSGNTYNRTRMQNAITAATAITAGHIICGTNSGYKNIGASIAFDLSYPLLYASSAIAATKTGDNNYLQINGISASNNGTITSGGANKTLYLKGTVTGNTFTISASPFMTTVVPTSADGFYYIPLGLMYSASAIYFTSSNRLYAYIDGAFQPVDTAAVLRAQDAKNLATAVYGTCSTAAGTATKSVACNNFVLFNGARIQVTFTYANTYANTTSSDLALNVNNTGAKSIYINKSIVSATNQLLWGAGSKMEFVYDGTGWVLQNAPFSLYGTCSTASATANKEVTCNEAVICKASVIYIKMTYSTTAADAKLNVASTGAKDIKANGTNLTANSRFNWNAGATIAFTFDGQYWTMSDDTITAYVTDTSDDGIMVHPVNDQNTGWSIGNSIQLLKNSISYIKLWLENSIAKIRIGEEDKGHIIINNNSVDVMNNTTCLASFGSTSTIGRSEGAHLEQSSGGLQVVDVDGNNQVIFGAQSATTIWDTTSSIIGSDGTVAQIELPVELSSNQNMTLSIGTSDYTIPTKQSYSYTGADYTISYDGNYIITITNLLTSSITAELLYPITQPTDYGITATTPTYTRIKARAATSNTVYAEGGIYANKEGNFGLYDTKHAKWLIVSDSSGAIKIPSLTPKLMYASIVRAHPTQNTWASMDIQLKQWAVIAIRAVVSNSIQYLVFFDGAAGNQVLTDKPGDVYIRGGFKVDWDNGKIQVRWLNGTSTTYQNVYFDRVYGLIRK